MLLGLADLGLHGLFRWTTSLRLRALLFNKEVD